MNTNMAEMLNFDFIIAILIVCLTIPFPTFRSALLFHEIIIFRDYITVKKVSLKLLYLKFIDENSAKISLNLRKLITE